MKIRIYKIGGLQLKLSPFLAGNGEMIRCLNTENDQIGAKKKRPGYVTFLGTPDNSQVNTLFGWTKENGTQLWNYRASGSQLYYSEQGTGDWTVCGNGTITEGGHVGHAVLEDTLIVGDGVTNTRHSTDGTSFTDTVAAPKAEFFTDYQNRIWAGGTSSWVFYSSTGTASDWTTDSSSLTIPGPGKMNSVFKGNDRLVATKNSGVMFRYDGYSLVDMATDLGPTSPYSIGEVEDYRLFLNRYGFFGYGGVMPELISNPIEKQIYNDANEGIVGTVFETAPGVTHLMNYLCTIGTVTDDLTDETIDDCIARYDYQSDEWNNWKFAHKPTAWCSYKNADGDLKLIFGDANGQCYTHGGVALTDNGEPIESVMEFVIWGDTAQDLGPEHDKKWNSLAAFFNPGSQAKLQVATSDTFTKGKKKWIDLGSTGDGVVEYRFPAGTRSKLLFVKISEASRDARYHFYGLTVDLDPIGRR